MKTFQRILSVCLVVSMMSISLMASNNLGNPTDIVSQQLRKEIMKMIDTPNLKNDEEQVQVTFMITKSNEVVVLKVESENIYLDSYIKANLNYHKVKTKGVKVNMPYKVKVTYQQ